MLSHLGTRAARTVVRKIKEEVIITVSAKAAGDQAATWAAKCAEQKQQYRSRSLCSLVSLTLQAPQAVKMEKQENCDLAKQLCAVIREERAKELARAGMGSNAARKSCTMGILKTSLTQQ